MAGARRPHYLLLFALRAGPEALMLVFLWRWVLWRAIKGASRCWDRDGCPEASLQEGKKGRHFPQGQGSNTEAQQESES